MLLLFCPEKPDWILRAAVVCLLLLWRIQEHSVHSSHEVNATNSTICRAIKVSAIDIPPLTSIPQGYVVVIGDLWAHIDCINLLDHLVSFWRHWDDRDGVILRNGHIAPIFLMNLAEQMSALLLLIVHHWIAVVACSELTE